MSKQRMSAPNKKDANQKRTAKVTADPSLNYAPDVRNCLKTLAQAG
jgi:hypothetical protein